MEKIEEVRAKIEQIEKHCNGFCWGPCSNCPTKKKLGRLMDELRDLFELTDMDEEEEDNADDSGTGD